MLRRGAGRSRRPRVGQVRAPRAPRPALRPAPRHCRETHQLRCDRADRRGVIEVRLWGDPFASAPESLALRATLLAADAAGVGCGLTLTPVKLRPRSVPGGRVVVLDDGCGGKLEVATVASEEEVAAIVAAVQRSVVATAPLAVFGDADDLEQAGLEHPEACAVLAGELLPDVLFGRVRVALADAGHDERGEWVDARELQGVASDVAGADPHRLLLVGSDVHAHGLDLALEVLSIVQREHPVSVTVVVETAALATVRDLVRRSDVRAEVRAAAPCELVAEHAVVLLPWRATIAPDLLVRFLATGRTVIASRHAATAAMLADGCCLPVGGAIDGDEFEPDSRHLLAQVRRAVSDLDDARARGRRGRAFAWTYWRGPRPALPPAAPPPTGERPSLVLEAPLFELSSSSLLTIATARALVARDAVDLFVVPRGAHQASLRHLRQEAPEVLERCVRQPPAQVDLWLATGWPPRAARPSQARSFAVRVDWEYGALPVALSPVVVREADLVVVHSHAVEATIAASGRHRETIALVPHGVDGSVFEPRATPLADVVRFKGDRAAILFTGGLIWRKGIDVLLNALLQMPAELRRRICLVVKPMGARTSYRGFELGELVHRFQRAGAVDTLVVDRELSPREMAGLYTASDVYAHPYRGEGFGLPVLEALACGVPAVVTAGGSTDDFAWGGGCLRVAAIHRSVELAEPCLSQPWVLEPDVGSLGAALARAVRERNELRQTAQASAPVVALRSSWSIAAAQLEALAARARVPARELAGVG
ncbi:MAG: glycosyltransferase [Planctomycetota bacterium]